MKRMVMFVVLLALVLPLAGCDTKTEEVRTSFEAEILEIQEGYYIVKPAEGSWELSCADQITVPIGRLAASPEAEIGDVICIEYDGTIAESYPAQIMKAYAIKIVKEVAQTEPPAAEPSQKKEVSADLWGITLTAENVTPTSLRLLCTQSGGTPEGTLQTGAWFAIERRSEDDWEEVPYIEMEGELAWTMEAYSIPLEDTVTFEVNWDFIYGELPAGSYRISKEIMGFRGPGNYDVAICTAEFEITE